MGKGGTRDEEGGGKEEKEQGIDVGRMGEGRRKQEMREGGIDGGKEHGSEGGMGGRTVGRNRGN